MTEKCAHDTNVHDGNTETANRGPTLPAPESGALALLLRWVDYLLGHDAVVVPVYGKRPIRTRWQTNGVKTIAEAKRLIRSGHATGMGLLLSDQFCSVDLDNAATAWGVLKAEGVECDAFGGVAIVSRPGKERHLFSAPPSLAGASPLALRRRTGEVTARGFPKVETVLEFRIGGDQQDLLPGSIHPETLAPYHGLEPPEGALPEPPEAIVRIFLAGGAGILRMQRQPAAALR